MATCTNAVLKSKGFAGSNGAASNSIKGLKNDKLYRKGQKPTG